MSSREITVEAVDHVRQVDAELLHRNTPVTRGVIVNSTTHEVIIGSPSTETVEGSVLDVTVTMYGREVTGQLIAPKGELLTVLRLFD